MPPTKSPTTDLETLPPKDWIVQLISSPQGELNVLTSAGRVFKRVSDASKLGQPGVHWTWQEIEGPKL